MMNLDPVCTTWSMHETASEAVLFAKEHLERKGYAAAERLGGYLPISDVASAWMVLRILEQLAPTVTDREAAEYVSIALSTVRRVLSGERGQLSEVA